MTEPGSGATRSIAPASGDDTGLTRRPHSGGVRSPSSDNFKLTRNAAVNKLGTVNNYDNLASIPKYKPNTVKSVNCKEDIIKEDDELPDAGGTAQNNNRTRKNNDRLYTQMTMKLSSPDLRDTASGSSLTCFEQNTQPLTRSDTLQAKFAGNPRINVEKSLASMDDSPSSRNTYSFVTKDLIFPVNGAAITASHTTGGNGKRDRKLSMPVSTTTSLELPVSVKPRERSASPARRKFSNVSDAVSRKISSTMGWRSAAASDEVVAQSKYICSQYIRSRLKRAGLFHKKLGLQRLRSVANLAGGWEVCEVFPRVSCLGHEMERSHPKLYGSVSRQISVALKSDKVVRHLMVAISSHLLRSDITWARLISLYAVAAALAADCVRQGHPEFVGSVVEGVGLAIEQYSHQWIVDHGGWSGVLVWSTPPAFEPTPLEMLVMVGGAGVLLAALIGGAITLLGHLVS